jgi:hypothetical protein
MSRPTASQAYLGGLTWISAFLALAAALFRPIFNPDLYWHLSAGRRIVELGAIPRTDWLSSTRSGVPWHDFEWLGQLLYYGVHRAGGMGGLWLLKGLIVGLIVAACDATFKTLRITEPVRPAALAVLGYALLPFADLRPDLFSALGVACLLAALERNRAGESSLLKPLVVAPFFALWANLHAGYPYGWALIGLYLVIASAERRRGLAAALLAGIVGASVQPAGPAAFKTIWQHWRSLPILSQTIIEWAPVNTANPWHWPFFAVAGLAAIGALTVLVTRKRLALDRALVTLAFGISAFRHVRLALFFFLAAIPASAAWMSAFSGGVGSAGTAIAAATGSVLSATHAAVLAGQLETGRAVTKPLMVTRAAEFLAREANALASHAVFAHSFEWGGYLGWRLWPTFKVFADGRYLFHDLQSETVRATMNSTAWSAFLNDHALNLVLLERNAPRFAVERRGRDGISRRLVRPYYALFMPLSRWALVYWDDDVLLFARRTAITKEWIDQHEYKLLRPDDDFALAEVEEDGSAARKRLEGESARHEREQEALAAGR